MENEKTMLESLNNHRDGWDEQFAVMSKHGDDTLLDGKTVESTSFDSDEWEWLYHDAGMYNYVLL